MSGSGARPAAAGEIGDSGAATARPRRDPASRRRRWLLLALRAGVTVGILGALAIWLPLDQLLAAMGRVGPLLWVLCVIVAVAAHVVIALKWRILLRASGLVVAPGRALRAHGTGLFASLWLPSLLGGDVVRAALVVPSRGALVEAASGGLADRVADAGVLVLLASIGAVLVPQATNDAAIEIIALAAAAILFGLAAAVWLAGVEEPRVLPGRIVPHFHRFRAAILSLRTRRREAVLAIGLSLAVQMLFVLLNAALGRAVGIEIALSGWMMAWPLAKLAGLLPISLAGWGVREAALAALLAPLGVDPTLAVAQSLVWETVLVALALIGGAGSLLASRVSPAPGMRLAAGGDPGVLVGEKPDGPDEEGR